MASRHGVSVQRVMDTFSAVIQIPLLKHASDARRYGKLGRERMKDWRGMNKLAEELHQEVNELNGVEVKSGNARKGRKRKLEEVLEVQGVEEAQVVRAQKVQKVQKSEEAAKWMEELFGESDAIMGDMAKNGGAAASA
jgi:hypothetical protein